MLCMVHTAHRSSSNKCSVHVDCLLLPLASSYKTRIGGNKGGSPCDTFAWAFTACREDRLGATGRLKLKMDQTYPLEQAAEAQSALAGRKTTGKVLLLP